MSDDTVRSRVYELTTIMLEGLNSYMGEMVESGILDTTNYQTLKDLYMLTKIAELQLVVNEHIGDI
jgi:hypothetical protein